MNKIRLGTRGSPLALWQANHVAERLRPVLQPMELELVIIETHGDQIQDQALASMGGFGVFTKALQQALLRNEIDLAVHSLKDLPTIEIPDLRLAAVPTRGSISDCFLSKKYARLDDVPANGVVGTSSLRRRAQLLYHRPDLQLVNLRGNLHTRIRKIESENLDGIILAQAGLERLSLSEEITEILPQSWMLPAVGQGAIGIECRSSDELTIHYVTALIDYKDYRTVLGERALLSALGGGCLVPIGVSSEVRVDTLKMRAAVLSPDGKRRIVHTREGPIANSIQLGFELAAELINDGANEILTLSHPSS